MAAIDTTPEKTLELLIERAKNAGDSFRIKIWRHNQMTQQTHQIALFSGAQLVHVTNPELWMPQLAGGGQFAFYVYHVTDPNAHLGGPLKFNVDGEARPVDLLAVKRPEWQGPKQMDFPIAGQPPSPSYAVGPSLNPTVAAPQTSVPGGLGGGPTFSSQSGEVARALAELQSQNNALLTAQRHLDSERQNLQLERIRMENDARMRDFEHKISAQAKPAEPFAGVKELIAPLIGLFQMWMQGQNEMRQLMFKLDQERANESRTMLMKVMERPAVDPLMMTLFEKLQGLSQANSPSAEMVGQMAELTMSMVDRAAEMANGQPESHWITAARELSKGLGAAISGMKVQKKSAGGQGGRPAPGFGLPGPSGIPQNTTAPGSYAAPASGFSGVPGTPAGNGAGAVPTQNYQPPSPQVMNQPAAPAAPAPVQETRVMSVIESLVAAVKAYSPVEQIAKAVIASLPDPGFQHELTLVDGSLQGLAAKFLGDWVPTDERNAPYLAALLAAIEKEGRSAGVFDTEEEAEVNGSDSDGDDESDQEETASE